MFINFNVFKNIEGKPQVEVKHHAQEWQQRLLICSEEKSYIIQ